MLPSRIASCNLLSVVLSSAFFIFAATGHTQILEHLKDAPFSASRISSGPAGKELIGRASDGSTYVEQFDSKGNPEYITIEDVPNQRMVYLVNLRMGRSATRAGRPPWKAIYRCS